MEFPSKILFGVDPGNTGAIAVFQDGELTGIYNGDVSTRLLKMLEALEKQDLLQRTTVAIECPPKIPFMNLKAIHSQLIGYGELVGIIKAKHVAWVNALPVTWQSVILPGRPSKKIGEKPHQFKKRFKAFGIATMAARFPGHVITKDGESDAVAIALWGLKQLS